MRSFPFTTDTLERVDFAGPNSILVYLVFFLRKLSCLKSAVSLTLKACSDGRGMHEKLELGKYKEKVLFPGNALNNPEKP